MKKSLTLVFLAVLATTLVAEDAGSKDLPLPTLLPLPSPTIAVPWPNPWLFHVHHGFNFQMQSHFAMPRHYFVPPPALLVPVLPISHSYCKPLTTPWFPCISGVGKMSICQARWYRCKGFPHPTKNPTATGYQHFHGVGSYKVHRQGLTWIQSLNVCASEGSILVVIGDNREATIIKNLIIGTYLHGYEVTRSGMYLYWIGAKEMGINKKFYTLLGNTLGCPGYLKWSLSGNQPDNNGNNDCVGFMHDGTNFDAVCNELKGFVCEKAT